MTEAKPCCGGQTKVEQQKVQEKGVVGLGVLRPPKGGYLGLGVLG